MAYQSSIKCERTFGSCDLAWMPLKNPNSINGNAPEPQGPESENDIVDDIIYYFRPNVFYSEYPIDSPVNRTYVYGTLYLAECLKEVILKIIM